MSKRIWSCRKVCKHEGCNEVAHYRWDTRREMEESRIPNSDFYCIRHTKPESILSITNQEITREVVSFRGEGSISNHLFWDGDLKSGFIHGDGFKAFAEDFPEGTKIIMTYKLVLPETA